MAAHIYTMKYSLTVTPRLDNLGIAIATENNFGSRTIHRARDAALGEDEEDCDGVHHMVVEIASDVVANADKLTVCAMLPSGGITAQAYLLKSHMLDRRVHRSVQMYTLDYDRRITADVRECMDGHFNQDAPRSAEKLVLVGVRLSNDDGAHLECGSLDRLEEELNEYNDLVTRETQELRKLDCDTKDQIDQRLSDPQCPAVEIVLLRGPQRMRRVHSTVECDGNVEFRVEPSRVCPCEYLVPRSAYLSVAINNTLLTPAESRAANVVPQGADPNQTSVGGEERSAEYGDKIKDAMVKGRDVLDLVNLAALRPEEALGNVKETRLNTRDMLKRWIEACTQSHAKESSGISAWLGKLTGADPKSMNLCDCLWNDLFMANECSRDKMSPQSRHFFAYFMPLAHGDFGPTSDKDPYRLDQSFIPAANGRTGKVVDSEFFFNTDCEVLSSHCLSLWRAQHEAVSAYLSQPDLLESVCTDKETFVTFMLSLVTVAIFPTNGLIQCNTRAGEHVVHCRCAPQESWNAATEGGKLAEFYKEGVQLRHKCEEVMGLAIERYNGAHEKVRSNVRQIVNSAHALYGHADVRVQDCTVACKTPNSFAFLSTLIAFYPYTYKDHAVYRFAPSGSALPSANVLDYFKGRKRFAQTLEACLGDPDNMLVACDSGEARHDISCLMNTYRQRLVAAARG